MTLMLHSLVVVGVVAEEDFVGVETFCLLSLGRVSTSPSLSPPLAWNPRPLVPPDKALIGCSNRELAASATCHCPRPGSPTTFSRAKPNAD